MKKQPGTAPTTYLRACGGCSAFLATDDHWTLAELETHWRDAHDDQQRNEAAP